MKSIRSKFNIVPIFMSLLVLCAISSGSYCQDAPDWVKGKFPSEPDAMFAIGMANIGANMVMTMKKVDDDARIELAKKLTVKVKTVFEKFTQESIDMLNEEAVSSIETSTEVTKTITEATLLNVVIVDHYQDEDNNIMYALAKMKKETVVSQFREVLDQDTKKIIKEDKKQIVMKNLDEELEKWDISQ